ncbi:MAG: MAPEG family protein [Alphaproteobacteria bacterium]|nr:MAG: MAPEG family protein [Alphaproteobacteria bacterium]
MTIQMVLLPVFVQVALTFGLLFWMASARTGSVRRGETKIRDIALGQTAWPDRPQQISNSYDSQFQLPLLFYVLVILAWITKHADLLFVVMAWMFVLLRLAHAYVHTTSNHVPTRFRIFAAGVFVLLLMWIIFAVRILLAIA